MQDIMSKLDANYILAGKGDLRIPHNRIISDFYSKIDLLLHPVREGKEGCSNTILESLASGVPVITTRYCGYHSEHQSPAIIITEGDSDSFIEKIEWYQRLPVRDRALLSFEARSFAEIHHDLRAITTSLLGKVILHIQDKISPKIAFVPFWGADPSASATTRLRNLLPCRLLKDNGYNCDVICDSSNLKDYDIVILSQLSSEKTLANLDPSRQLVIYDVCDLYFDDDRILNGVIASSSASETAKLSHLITVSTNELAEQVLYKIPEKPVEVLPDGIDYDLGLNHQPNKVRDLGEKSCSPTSGSIEPLIVCWFGNPGRGNLECVGDYLEYISQIKNISLRLFASKENTAEWKALQPYCKRWRLDDFLNYFKSTDIAILGHDAASLQKSKNRLTTAVWSGVVPIVVGDGCYRDVLFNCKLNWLCIKSYSELEYAIHRLRSSSERMSAIKKLKAYLHDECSDSSIFKNYSSLLSKYDGLQITISGKTILLVSHNLNIQEGAPNSLIDLGIGLATGHDARISVYSLFSGPLANKLKAKNIPWQAFAEHKSDTVENLLKNQYEQVKRHFLEFINLTNPDLIIFNTTKTLSLYEAASLRNIPYVCIIRESLEGSLRLDFGSKKVNILSQSALSNAANIIFVAQTTKDLWKKTYQSINRTSCIPNGIDSASFFHNRSLTTYSKRHKEDSPNITILSVGSINKRKRQRDIVEALGLIKDKVNSSIRLKLVGSLGDRYSDTIQARANYLFANHSISVELIAPTEDIQKYYEEADLFVFASDNESYPRVIIEAMLFGLPIISSKAYGTTEQIRSNIDGLMYTPGDISKLSSHLLDLINDSSMRLNYGHASAKRFFGLTSRSSMISQYAALIARTLI